MKNVIIALLLIFLSTSAILAEEEKNWEFRNYQTIRLDAEADEQDDTYLTRTAFLLYHEITDDFDAVLEIQPFVETRYLWDKEKWDRTELGAELGVRFIKWVYIGESIHYAWLKDFEDTPELESRLEIGIPFVLNSEGYQITLALLEEYTYSIEEGKATRNEIAGIFYIPVFEHLDVSCGWRHIDRIHDYDSDQVEISAVLKY